jgi:uncharacterized membrane protein YraQ (UPF0718 family)
MGSDGARENPARGAVDGDRRFTDDEQDLLRARLDQLERQIEAIAAPTPEQSKHLKETFARAKDTTARLSRSEWKMLFAGALIDSIINLALDPVRVQQIFHFANLWVGPLVSNMRGLLP